MTFRKLAVLLLVLAACSSGRGGPHGGGGTDGGGGNQNDGLDPNKDNDGDGYSPNQGDCDDTNRLVGPHSVEVPGNGIDDDCDGQVDNVMPCDGATAGMNTADALAQAIGICDKKFLTSASFVGPSDAKARNVIAKLGVVGALEGATMGFISTGEATDSSSYDPQPGTEFMNSYPSPAKMLPAPPANGCGTGVADTANDYTELELDLSVPWNANSFSFQSQFFSAEYPEYVCSMFNDRFLVVLDDGSGSPQQILFDAAMNQVTVNSGFFTVCQNDNSKPQTQHCTQPISDIMGSGYDQASVPFFDSTPVGGSTGWLTTTAPVTPGENIKLRFIIFDEFDWKYDSAALIDNFKWQPGTVTAPVTIQ